MNERTTHFEGLVEELREALALPTPDAARALDLLARCESYPAEERGELDWARSRIPSLAASLHLDLRNLLDRGFSLAETGDAHARLAWGRELLALAELAPYVPDRADAIDRALLSAETLLSANPAPFACLAALAVERRMLEGPNFPPLVEDLLVAFEELESLAALDRDIPVPRPLDALLSRIDRKLVEGADDALRDRLEWNREVRRILAAPRALAASGADDDHVLLRRVDEGELVLRRRGEALFAEWFGSGSPELQLDGQALAPMPTETGMCWKLPELKNEAMLVLRLGAQHLHVLLPTP